MPYITKQRREELKRELALTPGELNYKITELLKEYMFARTLSYQTINDIVGALEGAKLEFYRRIVAPFEESKIKQNGDVY